MPVGIVTRPDPWPACPDCGAIMVLRENSRTKERFWGCAQFLSADCRGSRNIDPETGLPEKDYIHRGSR